MTFPHPSLTSITTLLTISLATATPSSKRGLPFNETITLPSFENTAVSWCYNWVSNVGGVSTGNMEYIPMLHGIEDVYTSVWEEDVRKGGGEFLMSFNEPDIKNTYINPSQAAQAYKSHLSSLFPTKSLGAPALSNQDMTFQWWRDFLSHCTDCKIDFWPVHWYDVVSNGESFRNFINAALAYVATTGKSRKIWITEIGFRGSPSQEQMMGFLRDQLGWLDGLEGVDRYSFTAVTEGGLGMLVEGMEGGLSGTGKIYVS